MKPRISMTFIFFLCILSLHSTLLRAEEVMLAGYIKFGAILLSKEPNDNSSKHSRVGYLPIGAIVQHNGKVEPIFNHSEDVQDYENYLFVKSSTGYSGYVKSDLISSFENHDIIIPLRYNLIIRDINTKEKIGKVFRAESVESSTPLKLLRETDQRYIVEFSDEGKIKTGFIYKMMVDGVHFAKLSSSGLNYVPVIQSTSPQEFVANKVRKLSNYVSKKGGENIEKVIKFFSSLNMLQCKISSSADAELSGKIFGTGLGLSINFVIAEQDSIYSISLLKTINNKSASKDYYQFHSVKCLNGTPNRLENFILLSKSKTTDHFILSKDHLPKKLKENWTRFELNKSKKMIIIDGYNAYEQFMNHIGKSSLLAKLSYSDRVLLGNSILKQVAHFETPE